MSCVASIYTTSSALYIYPSRARVWMSGPHFKSDEALALALSGGCVQADAEFAKLLYDEDERASKKRKRDEDLASEIHIKNVLALQVCWCLVWVLWTLARGPTVSGACGILWCGL
jgi:hypothetical protein